MTDVVVIVVVAVFFFGLRAAALALPYLDGSEQFRRKRRMAHRAKISRLGRE